MLNFILGGAGCGKSYLMMQKINQFINNGNEVIFIVPEQFSFETDKKLLFLGYTVIHFWGQDIKKHTDECIQAIEEAIWYSTFSDSSFDSSDE